MNFYSRHSNYFFTSSSPNRQIDRNYFLSLKDLLILFEVLDSSSKISFQEIQASPVSSSCNSPPFK